MNILHISAVNTWGGGENHIENLCMELKDLRPDMTNIILCVDGGKFHDRLKNKNLSFITAPLKIKADPRYAIALGKACGKYNIDLIHIHDPTAIMQAIIADKFFKLPNFVFSKKTSFPIKDRRSTLLKYNYPKIKKILCVSEETKNIASLSINDKDKLEVIYHGTNFKTKSTETPFTLRERLNLNQDQFIVGNIANHIRAKNHETFIEMVNIVVNKKKAKNIHFVQIGSFTDRTENLKNMIENYNLENYISLLGHIPNASNFIPQFDLMVLTSQSEGLPQVIYESMYHKTAIVSTKVGGISEIVEHNKNGLLSPKHQPDLLANNVMNAINDGDLRDGLIVQAKESLGFDISTTGMAKKTLDFYKKILRGE